MLYYCPRNPLSIGQSTHFLSSLWMCIFIERNWPTWCAEALRPRLRMVPPIDIWLEYPSRYDAWTDGTQEALIILALHHIMKQSEP